VRGGGSGLILSSPTVRGHGLGVRARAAARSGFAAIGAHHDDLAFAREHRVDLEREAAAVEEIGVPVVEVGFLHRWAGPEAGAERRELFELAGRLGARRINAGLWEGPGPPGLATAFAELCRAAEDEGLEVALEFFPFGAIPTPAAALEVIEAADRPNARMLFDAWHFHRAGAHWDHLSALWSGLVSCLQISDAAPDAAEDVGEESRHARLLPGEGVIDLRGLLAELRREGQRPAVAVEVLSDRLDAEGPYKAAEMAIRAGRQALAGAGWNG
jgi:sugar phosphate isomerase/epimerase